MMHSKKQESCSSKRAASHCRELSCGDVSYGMLHQGGQVSERLAGPCVVRFHVRNRECSYIAIDLYRSYIYRGSYLKT